MSRFLTELDCSLKPGSDRIWALNRPLIYYSSLLDEIITVPASFETDLSSVPRVPLIFWLWGNRAHREGVLHDYLFRKDSVPAVPFETANRIFLESQKSRKKSVFVRYPMYWGVVVGARSAYHKKCVFDKL